MTNLIIHPKDPSTDFLKPIYATISDKTVITGGISKSDLKELITTHDRIIMLGHGTSYGLLAVEKFQCSGSYIIDYSMVELLSQKTNNMYIWCNADQFVKNQLLSGIFSGMFISEIEEAIMFDFLELKKDTIKESNNGFAKIVSKHINQPQDALFKNVIHEYQLLAKTNPIAQFNLNRLYLNEIKTHSPSVVKTQFL